MKVGDKMTTVLYIEDNEEIGGWVEDELNDSGMKVIWLKSGGEVFDYIEDVDFVILDVMLPGIDGFSLGTRIKQREPDMPIIMLTARTAVEDKVHGLGFADDYLTKPFHMEELIARIMMIQRRSGHHHEAVIHLNHLEVYPESRRIVKIANGEDILLSGKEFKIFFYLVDHLNQVLTKEQIYEAIWEEAFIEGDKSINVHVRHLREKIEEDAGHPKIIETIRGIGYRVRR